MFKLLDNKWRNLIINELQEHIGKTKNSKEISNRNIYIGTEGGGITVLDSKTGLTSSINGVTVNNVKSLYLSNSGILWI